MTEQGDVVELGRLYLVTDRRVAAERGRDLVDVVRAALGALPAGAALVQLREKDLPARELVALARRLLRVTRQHRCPLLVNDRVDVALAAGADGVHLPEGGLPMVAVRRLGGPTELVVGVSVHGADAAGAAARDGADLVVVGPIWDTPSKRALGLLPLGEDELTRAARAMAEAGGPARLFAIGGVTDPARAQAARRAGAWGVAGIRALMAADDPAQAAAALWRATVDQPSGDTRAGGRS